MNTFAAIDFETANPRPESICSVGLVVVRNGVVTDRFYHLVRPEPNWYSYFNTRVHGLTKVDTDGAALFPEVWSLVEPLIKDLPLVAHNKRFDEHCLREAFRVYRMDYPDYPFFCTLVAARKQLRTCVPNHRLDTVASYCGYTLENHHHALADAEACAAIALRLL